MKKLPSIPILLFTTLLISASAYSQRIYFYRDIFITGTVTDEQGTEHVWTNITLVKWDFSFGATIESYPYSLKFSGKYGDSKVEIPMENISKIVFEKEPLGSEVINFYATVYVSGNSRRLFLGKFTAHERRGPYFSLAGKSDFGDEVIKLWNVKELKVSSVDKAGQLRKE